MNSSPTPAAPTEAKPYNFTRLFVALIVVFVGGGLLKQVVGAIAGSDVAGIFAGGITWASVIPVYGFLSNGRIGALDFLPRGLAPRTAYSLPWWVMAAVGGLILAGVAQLGGALGALIGGDLGSGLTASILVALVGAFILGRWIGTRAATAPWVAAIAMVLLARTLATVTDLVLLGPDAYADIVGYQPTLDALLLTGAIGAVLWATPALVGVFFGRRAQESSYAAYLLSRLSQPDREAAIEILYGEATHPGPISRPAPAPHAPSPT